MNSPPWNRIAPDTLKSLPEVSEAIANGAKTFDGMRRESELTALALCDLKNSASEKRALIELACARIAAGDFAATDEIDHPQIAFNRRWCDWLAMTHDELKTLAADIAYEQRRLDGLKRQIAASRAALAALTARDSNLGESRFRRATKKLIRRLGWRRRSRS